MREQRARWLWHVLQTGGLEVSQSELEEHQSSSLMARFPTVARLQQYAESNALRGGELVGERDEVDAYVHEARTASGLRLEHRTAFDEEGKIRGGTIKVLDGGSTTAIVAAGARAAHLLHDDVRVHEDPLAQRLAGELAKQVLDSVEADRATVPSRWLLSIRSRFGEDTVKDAFHQHDVDQCVLLGAGLDSFAYRNELPDLQVFEVDLPESQSWKRRRLEECGVPIPPNAQLVPCDFEDQDFLGALRPAGFRTDRPAVFLWLGVIYYLTSQAIDETLRAIGSLPRHTSVVFDFLVPPDQWGRAGEAMEQEAAGIARVVALNGEPWLSHHTPTDLAPLLNSHGFDQVETYDWVEMAKLYIDGPNLPTMLSSFGLARGTRTK